MSHMNPLLELQASESLLDCGAGQRPHVDLVRCELRDCANREAGIAWRRRRGPMEAYWRALATDARHLAYTLSRSMPLVERESDS